MAFKRRTIVRMMVAKSGKDASEVSEAIGKDAGYVDRVISGEEDQTTVNTLALIARACGYRMCFVSDDESLELDPYLPPRDLRNVDIAEAGENEFTGKEISFTGTFFGLTEQAQGELCASLGASWVKKARTLKTDILVYGPEYDPAGKTSKQIRDIMGSERTHCVLMPAAEFADKVKAITGTDIA